MLPALAASYMPQAKARLVHCRDVRLALACPTMLADDDVFCLCFFRFRVFHFFSFRCAARGALSYVSIMPYKRKTVNNYFAEKSIFFWCACEGEKRSNGSVRGRARGQKEYNKILFYASFYGKKDEG